MKKAKPALLSTASRGAIMFCDVARVASGIKDPPPKGTVYQ